MLPLIGLIGGAIFVCGLMFVVWAIARRIHNAGIVDIAWAASFSGLVLIYAALGGGQRARSAAIIAMTLAWSMRLTAHLWRRVMGQHPKEDSRYEELRRRWGTHGPPEVDRRLFWFFQAQAIAAWLLSAPMLVSATNPRPGLSTVEWIGMAVWVIGLVGETVADRQLARFKADSANRGRTCKAGLWRYSRHPNYFFEWVIWLGFFLFALGSPWGWVTIYCPVLMLYILVFVTGIPEAEASALRSRGDEYREYQRNTSAFVPWTPGKNRP